MSLLDKLNIDSVAAAASAATSAVNGSTVDLEGYEGVIFFCSVAVANAGNFLKAQEGDTSSPTADLEGSAVVVGTNNDVVALNVHKPLKRYIRPVLIRGASTASGEIYAVKYGSCKLPDVGADVSKIIASPVAGTA